MWLLSKQKMVLMLILGYTTFPGIHICAASTPSNSEADHTVNDQNTAKNLSFTENNEIHEPSMVTPSQKPTPPAKANKKATYNKPSKPLSYKIDSDKIQQFYENLQRQLPDIVKQLPQKVKRLAIGYIEGPFELIDNLKLISVLTEKLHNLDKYDIFDCTECRQLATTINNRELRLGPRIQILSEFQKLKKEQNIDVILTGDLRYEKDEEKIVLYLQAIQTNTKKILAVLNINSTKPEENERDRIFPKMEFSSSWSLTPFLFGMKATSNGSSIDSFIGVNYRISTTTLLSKMIIGNDLDVFAAPLTPSSSFEGTQPIAVMILPFLQYPLKLELLEKKPLFVWFATGIVLVGGEIGTASKLGANFFINQETSLGLDLYLMSDLNYESEDDGNTTINTFSGGGMGLHIRFHL